MTKFTILTAASALALFAALPATAADLLVAPAAPIVAASAADWSGLYIGVHGGYGFGGIVDADDPELGYDISGALAGVQLGARQQNGDIVYGLQGDISWSGQSGVYHYEDGSTDPDDIFGIDWQGSLTGRLGIALDSALVYGLAGVTIASATADWGTPHSATLYGATVGAGVEFKLTDNLSALGEYSFTHFAAADFGSYSYGGNVHAVKVGLNYSF